MWSIHTLLVTLTLSTPALAQSFDCKLAQSPREQIICSDKKLSELDAELGTAYKTLRAQLSPESAAQVESDQREWLSWIDLVCPAHSKGISDDVNACLEHEYSNRVRDLEQTAPIGTTVIFPRGHFLYKAADPSDKMPANYRGFGYGTLRWPEIDRKTGEHPTAPAWNTAIKTSAAKLAIGFGGDENATFDTAVDPFGTINARYTIDAANDRLIDVTFFDVGFVDPALVTASGPGIVTSLNTRTSFLWWIDRNRKLTPTDVFLPSSDWLEHLVPMTTTRLQADPALKPLLRESPLLEQSVQQSISNPSTWILTRDGLTFTFLEGMVAGNPAGMPKVHFTWDELKPYLDPTLNPSTLPTPIPRATP